MTQYNMLNVKLSNYLMEEKLLELTKKNCRKQMKKGLELKK